MSICTSRVCWLWYIVIYRWFCFLDDDIYVNVPSLVKEFQQYDPLNNKVYLGHYPDSWGPHKVGRCKECHFFNIR